MAEKIKNFGGFRLINGSAAGFNLSGLTDKTVIYFVRTSTGDTKDDGFIYFNGKKYGTGKLSSKAVQEELTELKNEVNAHIDNPASVNVTERESGTLLAKSISSGYFTKFFSLSDSFSIVELTPPSSWVGHSLAEINPRKNYGVNVIGLIDHGNTRINLDPQEPMQEGWVLVVVGDNRELSKLGEHRG